MSARLSIQVKAAFLSLVFSLNTIIGFACVAGLDMGFNSKHHHHHDDEEVSSAKVTHHHESLKHHHDEELNKNNRSTDDDNCCNKNVIKFSLSDKLLTHVIGTGIEAPVTVVFIHSFYLFSPAPSAKTTKQIRIFRRGFLNSPDIRVSIQSFQI